MGKVSPIGSAHRYLSANNANNQEKKGEYEVGAGKGCELTLCFRIYI